MKAHKQITAKNHIESCAMKQAENNKSWWLWDWVYSRTPTVMQGGREDTDKYWLLKQLVWVNMNSLISGMI